jgi:hypothetical protein
MMGDAEFCPFLASSFGIKKSNKLLLEVVIQNKVEHAIMATIVLAANLLDFITLYYANLAANFSYILLLSNLGDPV